MNELGLYLGIHAWYTDNFDQIVECSSIYLIPKSVPYLQISKSTDGGRLALNRCFSKTEGHPTFYRVIRQIKKKTNWENETFTQITKKRVLCTCTDNAYTFNSSSRSYLEPHQANYQRAGQRVCWLGNSSLYLDWVRGFLWCSNARPLLPWMKQMGLRVYICSVDIQVGMLEVSSLYC